MEFTDEDGSVFVGVMEHTKAGNFATTVFKALGFEDVVANKEKS